MRKPASSLTVAWSADMLAYEHNAGGTASLLQKVKLENYATLNGGWSRSESK